MVSLRPYPVNSDLPQVMVLNQLFELKFKFKKLKHMLNSVQGQK